MNIINFVLKEARWIKEAFPVYEKAVETIIIDKKKGVEELYDELVINKRQPIGRVTKILDKMKAKLPKNFKEDFLKFHKEKSEDKDYKRTIAKIGGFTLINFYKDVYGKGAFKEVREFIKDVVRTLKSKGYGMLAYGDIRLQNPRKRNVAAEYFYDSDHIRLRLYRNYAKPIKLNLFHELAHRIWHQLFMPVDIKKWEKEFYEKSDGKGFPTPYSKTEPQEYFAEVIAEYLMTGKKYSDLLDEIF